MIRRFLASRRRVLLLPSMGVVFTFSVAFAWIKREEAGFRLGDWRSGSLLEKSKLSVARGDWSGARRSALAAWQLHPGNVDLLRQIHVTMRGTGDPGTLSAGLALFDHPEAESEDRLGVIRFLFGLGDHVGVSRLLARLGPDERDLPEALDLRIRFLLARDQPVPALILVDRLRRERNDPADLLLAAEVLLRVPSDGDLALDEAQRILSELFKGETGHGTGLDAFRLLRRIPPEKRQLHYFSHARERLEAIALTREVPAEAWLLVEELDLLADPTNRDAILDGAVQRWREEEPLLLGQWLLSLGETEKILEHYPRRETVQHPELMPLLVQTLILEEEWDRALSLLDRTPRSSDPIVIFSLRAMIQVRIGEEAEAGQNWIRALRYAELESGRDSLLRLARLATLGNNAEIRDRAVTEALKRPAATSIAASDVSFLFPGLVETDRDEDLLEVSLGLLSTQPENAQLLNNVVWLELLRGRLDAERVGQLEQLAERFPTLTGLKSTLALARLSAGRPEAALETLSPPPVESSEERATKAAPADLAVLALVLAENGQVERARNVARSVRWEDLMAKERHFFLSALEEELDEPVDVE